jgi:hypothetical protein
MSKISLAVAFLGATSIATTSFAQAPPPPPAPGTVVLGAPKDITLEIKTGPDGGPMLSAAEFRLALGGYYRFNIVCPDAKMNAGFHFESPDLMANMHLRVVSIAQIEIYMQGQTFRAIECDDAGAARFSFHPMRKGSYDILVRNQATPPKNAHAKFIVE